MSILTQTFDTILDDPDVARYAHGTFFLETANYTRKINHNHTAYYDDGTVGFNLSGDFDYTYDGQANCEIMNKDGFLPIEFINYKDIVPGTFFKPNGEEIKKSYLDNHIGYMRPHNGNLIYSTHHKLLSLMDHRRHAKDPEVELQNPSFELGSHSILYIPATNNLCYDPLPIKTWEPDPEERDMRYAYIESLMPTAKMYYSLNQDKITSFTAHGLSTYFKSLQAMYKNKHSAQDLLELAAEEEWDDNHFAIDTFTFLAIGIQKLEVHSNWNLTRTFNQWVNGIIQHEYPYLLYYNPEE